MSCLLGVLGFSLKLSNMNYPPGVSVVEPYTLPLLFHIFPVHVMHIFLSSLTRRSIGIVCRMPLAKIQMLDPELSQLALLACIPDSEDLNDMV